MFVLCQCVGHVPWISGLRIECPSLVPLGAPSPHRRSVRVVACIIRDVAAKVPRRNPPRPTDNEQHIQHTHTNVHRVHLVNGQPGQQPARRSTSLQRWEATKDPRIVMHLPVQSDGAVDISSVPLRPPSIPAASTRVTCASTFGQKN